MQDRVSLYPGRVTLTPVQGQENTFDMVRADQPTQEGTSLNKASLLKDQTAALYGLGNDAVPDDVFQRAQGLVGDVRFTRHTDLGDKWLLCNGDRIDENQYPDLVEFSIYNTPMGKWFSALPTGDASDKGDGKFSFENSMCIFTYSKGVFYSESPKKTGKMQQIFYLYQHLLIGFDMWMKKIFGFLWLGPRTHIFIIQVRF